jgi:hypothetical protein
VASGTCNIKYCGRRYTFNSEPAATTGKEGCLSSAHTNQPWPANCAYCAPGYVLQPSTKTCVRIGGVAGFNYKKENFGCLAVETAGTGTRCAACAWPLVPGKA